MSNAVNGRANITAGPVLPVPPVLVSAPSEPGFSSDTSPLLLSFPSAFPPSAATSSIASLPSVAVGEGGGGGSSAASPDALPLD